MSARIGFDSEPRGLPRLPLVDVTNKTAAGETAPLAARRREADRLRKAAKRKSAEYRKREADATRDASRLRVVATRGSDENRELEAEANRLRVAEMRESEEYAAVSEWQEDRAPADGGRRSQR